MCASKIDLREDPEVLERLEEKNWSPITSEEGIQMAKKLKCIAYVENSAKTQKGLKRTFDLLLAATTYRPIVGDSKSKAKKKEKCALQ